MTKKAFEMIAAGLEDAIAIAKGEADPSTYRVHAPADIDVLKIRRALGLTREAFAMRFGLELGTVRDWEQRKRKPEGPARVLLAVIKKEPDAVTRSLAATVERSGKPVASRASGNLKTVQASKNHSSDKARRVARLSKQGKRT
jgi:putative transcriptional regulator